MAFSTPTDVGKRICQHLGVRQIGTLGDNSIQAVEISSIFDKIRQAELRAHLWRFATRHTALRPAGTGTMRLITFPTYASGTTYQAGDVVTDPTTNAGNSGTALYLSTVASNIGNTPSSSPASWTPYFGVDCADSYSASNTYSAGEIVYYSSGSGSKLYMSTGNGNVNNTPTGGAPWTAAALTGASTAVITFFTPIGQFSNGQTRTLYRLPYGYMRVAPQDAKTAGAPWQTVSAGMQFTDFEIQGNFLLTNYTPTVATNGPLIFRFGADISNVAEWDAQFAESLAVRGAFDLCERLTGKDALKQMIDKRYTQIISSAWRDNLLEQGSTDPEEGQFSNASLLGTGMSTEPARGNG